MKQYIFTIIFALLILGAQAKHKESYYYVGVWDGSSVQINNPNIVNKNKFCIGLIRINGKKVKTNYKIGGIEINPANFEFKKGQEFLIEIVAKKDCEPSFNSTGFKIQR